MSCGQLNLLPDGSFTYTPNANFSGTDSFTYVAQDAFVSGNVATVTITVNAVADAPILNVANSTGFEGAQIPLNIIATLADTDGSESLSITISGVPANVSLSAGTNNGGGSWTLTPSQQTGLTLLAPDDASFVLTVQATATEASNGSSASSSALLSVTVNNAEPVITSLTNSAAAFGSTLQGQSVSLPVRLPTPARSTPTLS